VRPAAHRPPRAAAYGAEKAKINALMESLDAELKLAGHHDIIAQSFVIG
jgi:NAD(P)-dependent dehydrogenase (short-subunit alcohol dehydrogenase family)